MPQLSKFIKSLAFIVSVLAISLSLGYLVSAWTEPGANPPTPNVSAPLNVSSIGQSKAGGLILNTGGAPNGLIVQNGNVGIGTTSPATGKLHIERPAADASGQTLYLRTFTDGVDNNILMYADNDAGTLRGGQIGFDPDLVALYFDGGTGAKEMVIKSGNVGIGTTSPGAKLDIQGGDIKIGSSVTIKGDGSVSTGLNSAKVGGYTAADLMAAGGGGKSKSQYFTSNGTFTVPTDVTLVWITAWGGGGGGGGGNTGAAKGGGGGSGEVIFRQPVVVSGNIDITVGAGGGGGAQGANGNDGVASTFGSLVAAAGKKGLLSGGAGGAGGGALGGAGGASNTVGSVGSEHLNVRGGSGGGGGGTPSGSGAPFGLYIGGVIGSHGGGGAAGYNGNGANGGASAAANSGAGGGGGTNAGGNGGSGGVIVEWVE